MFVGHQEQATGYCSPIPDFAECRLPPLATGDSMITYTPERRRIVALVRRKALKIRGFFAAQKYFGRGDDLLTTPVDNVDPAGL